jgi:hypothetical protein
MQDRTTRALGLAVAAVYAIFIAWLYARQPQTIAQVTGGLTAAIGAYRIDQQAFDDARRFFRADHFPEARLAFARADPAERDPRTQFYIAYTYYREGWGRVYHDAALYRLGLEALDRAVALAPAGRLVVEDDPNLKIHSADELRTELEAGIRVDASDLNPMRLFSERK